MVDDAILIADIALERRIIERATMRVGILRIRAP